MKHDPYINRTYEKIEKALEFYGSRIFKTIGWAEHVYSYSTQEHLRQPPAEALLQPIAPETSWGGEYSNLWLCTALTVPNEADGRILCAIPEADAVEILCFKNGIPAGIINSKNQFIGGAHSAMFIDAHAQAGEHITLAFDCYAGHDCLGTSPYDNYDREECRPQDFTHIYHGTRFVIMDEVIRDFIFDVSTVLDLARLPGENFAAMKAHQCLINAYPYMIQDVKAASDEELRSSAAKVSELLAPALAKQTDDRTRGKVGVIGHSHMDTAWLWPVSETIRKCARTYSQALTLMDMYPDYKFIQSSALHLDWMREYYPDIFEGIKQKVVEGRYEPNGGVWVECDCNIASGESMVRQFLYGQRFTMKHFGYRSDCFWLPDTFGYNAAIPQIMLGSGVKYFYTTKMDWNDLNKFPAHTFVWRGLDGSEVITHLNRHHAMPTVHYLTEMVTELKDKHSCDMRLLAYGFGDGGGGPTYGMLEYLKRTKDLAGLPQVETTTISKFMQEIDEQKDQLPMYDGELYLELHRGTLTQMHEVKRNNRKAEIALYKLELFNVLAGQNIDEDRDTLYKTLLKNQFHDILPGTSIPRVYELAIPEMHDLISQADQKTAGYASQMSSSASDKLSVYNPLSFERSDVLHLQGAFDFADCPVQIYQDQNGQPKTAIALSIPAMSSVTLHKGTSKSDSSVFVTADNELVTPFYIVSFDENGYICSLFDREAERQVHREGGTPLGTLWFGEDMPRSYDNWDIDDDAFIKLRPVTDLISREVVSNGSVEYRVRCRYKLGKHSMVTIDTVFYAANRRIDFETEVQWSERHALLKAGFDVNVRSAFVKNEIQFGHIERPTTRNNSLEASKFEICNHKWSDLSETHYGVALLNDCKYGLSVNGTDMQLTLHKGGCRPDPTTDNGTHVMTYSLLPHCGAFDAKTVIHPAYELNYDAICVPGELNVPKLFSISNPGIICEAVKNAEDVPGAYVLRLYEAERNTSNCTLKLNGASKVWLTNMLEEPIEQLPVSDGNVQLKFRPFEIKTILVER